MKSLSLPFSTDQILMKIAEKSPAVYMDLSNMSIVTESKSSSKNKNNMKQIPARSKCIANTNHHSLKKTAKIPLNKGTKSQIYSHSLPLQTFQNSAYLTHL